MSATTVSGKGWVVIPKEIRERHGLVKGRRVHVIDYGGVITIVPASANPIEESFGMLRGKGDPSEALRMGRAEDEEKFDRLRSATRKEPAPDGG